MNTNYIIILGLSIVLLFGIQLMMNRNLNLNQSGGGDDSDLNDISRLDGQTVNLTFPNLS